MSETDLSVLEDPRIADRVRRRDPEAMGRVFDAAFPWLFGLAVRMTGDRTAAEDVVQDVFLKVHRAADRIDPARPLKPWLTTIAVNACRDRLRRRGRRSEESVDPASINGFGHTTETPEYSLMRTERQRRLETALRALDEKDREILVLRVFGDHSHEEVAEMLGLAPAAARKRYSRALARLRARVGKDET